MVQSTLIHDRYRLLELIGRGGMGEVWRAQDESLGRRVAVKCLKPLAQRGDAAFLRVVRERFRREARVAAALQHPGVTVVHDFGDDEGLLYLVMELLEGRNLSQLLEEGKRQPLPVAEVLDVAEQVSAALAYTHEQGVVHRDLKPANVMRTTDGAVKICDFGIARLAHDIGFTAKLTGTGIAMGTPHYMSPEQIAGTVVDHRSDLYSFGCVLYELATGGPPFRGGDAWSVLVGHRDAAPEPPRAHRPELPPPLEEAILRLLAKAPDGRPDGAAELSARLAAARACLPGWSAGDAARDGAATRGSMTGAVPGTSAGAGAGAGADGDADGDAGAGAEPGPGGAVVLDGRAWPESGAVPERSVAAQSAEAVPDLALSQGAVASESLAPPDGAAGARDDAAERQGDGAAVAWQGGGVPVREERGQLPVAAVADGGLAGHRDAAPLWMPRWTRGMGGGLPAGGPVVRRTPPWGWVGLSGLTGRWTHGARTSGSARPGVAAVGAGGPRALSATHRPPGAYGDVPTGDGPWAPYSTPRPAPGPVAAHRPATPWPAGDRSGGLPSDDRRPTPSPALSAVLASRHKAGESLGRLGCWVEAYEAHVAVAAERGELLGPCHPDTLDSRLAAGHALGRLHRWDEALAACRSVAQDRARVLGDDHPRTLAARDEWGLCLDRSGRVAEAEELYRELAAARSRVHGAAAPETLRSLHGLATSLGGLGRWEEALEVHRHVASVRHRVLGPGDPGTLASRGEEAHCLERLGRGDEAADVYRALALRC